MPKWVIDVSTVIHFYEAALATLAILAWHLYFVVFDPLVYPWTPRGSPAARWREPWKPYTGEVKTRTGPSEV